MKVWGLVFGALAALGQAAPTSKPMVSRSAGLEPRSRFDASGLNGLVFAQQDLNYLQSINSFNLNAFQRLGLDNHVNLAVFSNVFSGNVFDINSLLALQAMNTLVQVANVVPFGNVDLSAVQFGGLELAALGNIGSVGLGQFVDSRQLSVIQGVVSQVPAPVII